MAKKKAPASKVNGDVRVEVASLDAFHLDEDNVRLHPESNKAAILASLKQHGPGRSILVDRNNVVRAGNGTLEQAAAAGVKRVIVVDADDETLVAVRRSDFTDAEARAYAIADNRASDLSTFDDAALAKQMQELERLAPSLLSGLGFTDKERAALIGAPAAVTVDEVPEPPAIVTTKPGDLWLLGSQRLLCGDSTSKSDVAKLMAGKLAKLCFTSPPYGQQRDYTPESAGTDWDRLMLGVFEALPMDQDGQVLVNLGLVHREGEWLGYWDRWLAAMGKLGWRRFGWYVWDQGFGLPGDWSGRFAPSHEFVFHFNREAAKPAKCLDKKPENIKARAKGASTMRGKDGVCREFSSPEASALGLALAGGSAAGAGAECEVTGSLSG